MRATAWSLDEFAVADGFDEFTSTETPLPSPSADEMEADFQSRLTLERSRAESAAYSRGRDDGERAARAGADEEISSVMAALSDALANVQLHEARWVSNAEENIAALAIMVARHIVQREVMADPTIVRDLVQRALSQIPMDSAVTVRLHPDDAATCSSLAAPDPTRRLQDLRLIADANITRGGCLIEGRERIIDGRVDTSLERAYRSIGQIQA